jgi:hypothetical protein
MPICPYCNLCVVVPSPCGNCGIMYKCRICVRGLPIHKDCDHTTLLLKHNEVEIVTMKCDKDNQSFQRFMDHMKKLEWKKPQSATWLDETTGVCYDISNVRDEDVAGFLLTSMPRPRVPCLNWKENRLEMYKYMKHLEEWGFRTTERHWQDGETGKLYDVTGITNDIIAKNMLWYILTVLPESPIMMRYMTYLQQKGWHLTNERVWTDPATNCKYCVSKITYNTIAQNMPAYTRYVRNFAIVE